jgi:glycosyltransferase involved in cell wall biosynthesis
VIGRRRRRRLDALEERQAAQFEQLSAQLAATQASVEALAPLLRTLAADDPGHRRRLHAQRADPGFAAAWDEPDPLVTISIPTRSRPRLLVERSLSSALAQTHEHLEVLVIGDAAGPEIAAAVEGVGDPRVRYVNLTHQFVRADGEHWLTAATLTRNEAYRLARGRWLVDLDDDDALRPGAVAALLAHARAERLEVAYGVLEEHHPGGATKRLGGFPPAHGQFGWQGAVVYAGLRFFERELVAADLGWSGDWFRVQRMLRAGVRIGHLHEVTCDYYPSFLWGAGD